MPTPRKIDAVPGVAPAPVRAMGKVKPVSVRPSPDEWSRWKGVAEQQHVSLHSLLLFFIRRGMADVIRGRLEIPKEAITTERIRMP